MTRATNIPINIVHMLPALDTHLIILLQSLTDEEWKMQTVAKLWKVKDVAAHLLDGNIRVLSALRDGFQGESPSISSYQDLLNYLNGLNADWVKAMKRVSPQMLILLHQLTGPQFCDYYASLDPMDPAAWSVAWAGEMESKNWMHIAREYTEKFLHQQQIREAVGKPGLMTREFYFPFINILMFGLPHTYRDVSAEEGTAIKVTITTDIGGEWILERGAEKWNLVGNASARIASEVIIDPNDAWKLFSKSIRPADIRDKVRIFGDQLLGETALNMISVMA